MGLWYKKLCAKHKGEVDCNGTMVQDFSVRPNWKGRGYGTKSFVRNIWGHCDDTMVQES